MKKSIIRPFNQSIILLNNYLKLRYRYVFSLILLSVLWSCKTSSVTNVNKGSQIKRIGFINIENTSIISHNFPNANKIYISTVPETFSEYNVENLKYINIDLSYAEPDFGKIEAICKESNLDGIILARIRFSVGTVSVNYNPAMSVIENFIELKLIDNDGLEIASSIQSISLLKSDYSPAAEQKIIHDGSKKAIKKLAKLLGLKKVK